jgi:hypothetical protein
MINFFRKIRRKLADDNKPLKYMRYAIGEIVLVVVGILIALSVNNWNEENKERKKETKALITLIENMELNSGYFEDKMKQIQSANKSAEIIFAAIKLRDINTDTLGHHFRYALTNYADLWLSQSGYESLKNLGFDIIEDEELKKEIINLHENTYLNMERSQEWGNNVAPHLDSYLIKHFIRYKGKMIPRDFNQVANDEYFYGLINVAESQRNFYYGKYSETLDETKRVLELITNKMKKSD